MRAGDPMGEVRTVPYMTQPTLFDDAAAEPQLDISAFSRGSEQRLDQHSWITYVPGLLAGHQHLMEQLATVATWERRQRWMFNRMVDEPRLTAEYNELASAPAFLAHIAKALSMQLGIAYDGIWLNWYRDHRDGTGWHADRPANKPQTAIVPVLSLGAPRRFLIRPAGGGNSVVLTPAGGDLLIMAGRCQRDWQHSVPKQRTPAGPRMSLNFSSRTQS